jgi:hypothetical protein
MPPSLVHRAMSGERQLQLDELERIAPALGLEVGWLLVSALMRVPRSGECSESNGEPRQE